MTKTVQKLCFTVVGMVLICFFALQVFAIEEIVQGYDNYQVDNNRVFNKENNAEILHVVGLKESIAYENNKIGEARTQNFMVTEVVHGKEMLLGVFHQSKIVELLKTMFSLKTLGLSLLIALISVGAAYMMHNQKIKASSSSYEITNSFLLEQEKDVFSHVKRSSRTIKSGSKS